MLSPAHETAFAFVDKRHHDWSQWNAHIWALAETAWREYGRAEWYVKRRRAEGFTVEAGSGGMPTAFSAAWSNPMHGTDSSKETPRNHPPSPNRAARPSSPVPLSRFWAAGASAEALA